MLARFFLRIIALTKERGQGFSLLGYPGSGADCTEATKMPP